MIKRIRTALMLILLLSGATQALAQATMPEKVCVGTDRRYWVVGTPGSVYTWKLDSVIQTSTTDQFNINWSKAGIYKLEVQEHGERCSGEVQTGLVSVYDPPLAFAGDTLYSCSGSAVSLTGATAQNYSSLLWTSSGDGTFADATTLQALYNPGPKDIQAGVATLSIMARGQGDGTSCTTAFSKVILNVIQLEASVLAINVSCFGAKNGGISITNPTGGSGNYEFTINGSDWTRTNEFASLAPGLYPVQMRDRKMPDCIVSLKLVTLTEPDPLSASTRFTNASCLGNDGTINITNPKGGSGSYEYSIGGNWANGFFDRLSPGTYQVQIRDANVPECLQNLTTVTITQPEPITGKVSVNPVSCFGAADGSISVTEAVNGSGIYEFSIDGNTWISTNKLPFSNLSPGPYPVWIRDKQARECTVMLTNVMLTEPDVLTASYSSVPVSCFGGNDGQIILQNPAGGSGSYEYSLDGTKWGTGLSFTDLRKGTYTIRMRDFHAPACVRTIAVAQITEPEQLSATVSSTDISCFGSNDGRISLTNPLHGKAPYQYSIDSLNWLSDGVFTGLGPKTYTVQMRDANGCTQKLKTIIIVEPDPLSATVSATNVTCLGKDGTITITNPRSGSGFYEYALNDSLWTANGLFTKLSAGSYQVKIRDARLSRCERMIETVTLTLPEPLSASAGISHVTCFEGNDGAITILNPKGGSGIYEYRLDSSSWSQSVVFNKLTEGSYTIQMRDAMATNCTVTLGQYPVNQPELLSATPIPTDLTCFEGKNGYISFTYQQGGSGKYEYSLNGTDWSSDKISNLKIGKYAVQMRDAAAQQCIVTLPSVEIRQPDRIIAAVDPTHVTCFGGNDGTITISKPLNGVEPYQYSLDDGKTWQQDGTFTGLTAKTYDLMVIQDVNACTAKMQTVVITQPDQLEATVTHKNETNPDAGNGTITISNQKGGSGEYQYSIHADIWVKSPEFTNVHPGEYTVRIRDGKANDCMISRQVIILPAGTIQAQYTFTGISCYNGHEGTITITDPSGAANYQYSITAGSSWQYSPYFPGLTAQNYKLMVRDADLTENSTDLGTILLKQPAMLNATVTVGNENFPGASDGTLTVNSPKGGSGEYRYSLDATTWTLNPVFAGLSSGTYTIWIQDKNAPDCSISIQKVIQPAGSLSATVDATNVSCNGKSDGTLSISGASGASEYDYSIDAGKTWQPLGNYTGLPGGTYNPMLRDRSVQANKIILGETIIREPRELEELHSANIPLCAGTSGTFTIFARGGTGIISGTGTFDMAAGEKRDFVITDENNCTVQVSFTMPAPDKITAFGLVTKPSCWDGNGTVSVLASGGTGVYSGAQTYSVQPGKPYSFYVTDRNGCVSNRVSGVMAEAPAKLEVTAVTVSPLCFGDKGTITANVKGGSGNYRYQWDDPEKQTTPTATGLAPGVYSVSVTDDNNCTTAPVLALVKEAETMNPKAGVSIQPDCLVPSGTIEFTEPLGATYEYSPDGIDFKASPIIAGLAPGKYSAQARIAATGCLSRIIEITVNAVPVVQEVLTARITAQPSCRMPAGTITVSSPLGENYEYSLDGINYFQSPVFANLAPGNYFVSLRLKSSGCEKTSSLLTILPVPPVPETPTASVTDQPDCFIPTGTIRVTAPLGPAYQYSVDGLNYLASPVFTNLAPATYTVKVQEIATGCESAGNTLTIHPALVIPPAPVSSGDLMECQTNPIQTLDANSAIQPVQGQTITWWDAQTGGKVVNSPTLNQLSTKTWYAQAENGVCSSLSRTPVSLTIQANPAPPVAQVTVHPSCNLPNGTVVVTHPKEGTGFEYNMDDGPYRESATFTLLKWGDHSIRVRQTSSGCISETPTIVFINAIPPAPVLQVSDIEDCLCNGGTGSISFKVSNATDGEYTIKYEDGEFENIRFTGSMARVTVPAGTYMNLTIEANGCTSEAIATATVAQPSLIEIDQTVTEIDLKSGRKGAIDLHVSGGSENYSYLWSNGATTEDIIDLTDGAYTVLVTDRYQCTQEKTITIPIPNLSPVAKADDFSVGCEWISGSLVANDSDPENDPFFLDPKQVEPTLHGNLTLNADGTFEYQPDPRFSGTDYFSYAIYDAKHYLGDTARVTLTIISDLDCDGIADDVDPDADGDGILTLGEGGLLVDTDGDGTPNYLDIDSDNDGIVDNIEAQSPTAYIAPLNQDTNGNGLDDAYDTDQKGKMIVPVETDKDGIPDFLDVDSDNDLVPDYIEGHDPNGDGKPDQVFLGKDTDQDGLDDAFDTVNRYTTSGNMTGSNAAVQDFDGDGIPDWRDENDDNDLYLTRFEDLNADGDFSNDDTDHDGHPEYLDSGRDCNLFIPNIFTPNSDNIHDYFVIYCMDHYPNAKIYIFDQNGNKIFEKDHYGNLNYWGSISQAWWNGRDIFKGNANHDLVPVGTYYYVLNLGNGEVKKSYIYLSY